MFDYEMAGQKVSEELIINFLDLLPSDRTFDDFGKKRRQSGFFHEHSISGKAD
jgi:hypothetical protein